MMKSVLLTAAALSILAGGAEAQVLYTTPNGTYTQNFDTLLTAPENTATAWVDNTTIPGWYSTVTTYRPSPGTSTTGSLYAFGSTGSTDRALGSIASGTTGTITYGLRLTNNTGQALTSFTLGYTGEQWRDGGGATAVPNTLGFAYSLNATGITTGTFTPTPALSFTSPINSLGSATALNGNAPANRVAISGTVSSILWAPGTDIWLQWSDPNDAETTTVSPLDDLTFSAKPSNGQAATPEPGAIALFSAFGVSGLALLRRRRAARR